MSDPISTPTALIDRFGRKVTYLRVSVTDRCDFRCLYCMSEEMTFLPRPQILTLEEIQAICRAFVELGVEKIRITGGEPLVRKGVERLFSELGRLEGLRELTLTTNGSHLERFAARLREAGVRRVNVSLDTLKAARFTELTRVGELARVLKGIEAALAEGLRVKLNAVILRHRNHDEVIDLVEFALDRGVDISFIEEMPLGRVDGHDRGEAYCSSDWIRGQIESRHELLPSPESTGGPSRYYRLSGHSSRIGFISPHSHNFCASCNRVRLTAEGRLLLCLGNEHSVDLKQVIRASPGQASPLKEAIVSAMEMKPERHHFDLEARPVILRHMSVTGG